MANKFKKHLHTFPHIAFYKMYTHPCNIDLPLSAVIKVVKTLNSEMPVDCIATPS